MRQVGHLPEVVPLIFPLLLAKSETVLQDIVARLIGNRQMLWSGNECVKSRAMGIATQASRVTIRIDQKQLANGEYFSCLGSMVTFCASCARAVKSRIAKAKAAFNKKTFLY